MGIFSFLSDIVSPVTELIGKVVTKEEDILKVQAAIANIENQMALKLIDYENKLLDARAKVIIADAQGKSWLQRCWRPITMLTFLCLVVADVLNLLPEHLGKQAWTVLTIGIGGHVVTDAAERVAPHISRKINPLMP